MDNVCHTLVGAALAESGLGRRTSLGFATLLIGANLADLDVLAYLDGPFAALEWRRGWSHGVLAMAVLPLVLTGFMVLVDRTGRRLRRAVLPTEVRVGQIFLLSCVAIISHPLLDLLNTYGVRWLVPLSGQWSYGDALFIIDPWLWLVLGAGAWASRKRRHARERNVTPEVPARRALLFGVVYIAAMAVSGAAAARAAARELRSLYSVPVSEIMAGPVALSPFTREIVARQDSVYRTVDFRWLRRPWIDPAAVRTFSAVPPPDPRVATAAASPDGRRFLGWARFPTFSVERSPSGDVVHIVDLRYADRIHGGFGTVAVPVGR